MIRETVSIIKSLRLPWMVGEASPPAARMHQAIQRRSEEGPSGALGLKHCGYFQGRIGRTVVCGTGGSSIAEEVLGFLK